MNTPKIKIIASIATALLLGGSLLLGSGCTSDSASPTPLSQQNSGQVAGAPAPDQPVFDTDQQLADTLVAAAKAQDHDKIHQLLGPAWQELVSGDKVEDADAFKEFTTRADQRSRLERHDGAASVLVVGNDNWPFPIPLAKTSDGKWFLDTEAGKSELLARRIGRNELQAIQVCRIYVDAQREYASAPRDDTDVIKYAQRILSTPGKHDGLYWPASAGESPSPLDHLISQAKMEGYSPAPGQHSPLQGYRFRVLKAQGPAAPGGQYSYIINGNMVAGFALIAYPVEYESSGIMSFIVNQRGKVYQKDLGDNSMDIARQITQYNPDSSWTEVKD